MQIHDTSGISQDRFRVLRLGRDWQEILYRQNIQNFVLKQIWGESDLKALAIDGSGVPWQIRTSGLAVVLQREGFYVRLDVSGRDPKSNEYPVRIQVQGQAFAHAEDMEARLSEIERYLWPNDPPVRFPGRVDIAADIWISDGDPEAAWLARSLHRQGSPMEAVLADWATHARNVELDARIKGRIGSETFYLGNRSLALLRAYRKDIAFEGNTAEAYKSLWASQGYDGSGAVLRIEAEIHRAFFRKHGDPKSGILISELDWTDYGRNLRTLWLSVLDSFSWRPETPNGSDRKSRRSESPLWQILRSEPVKDVPTEVHDRFVRIDRLGKIERLIKDVQAASWRAQEALGDSEANWIICSALDARASPQLSSIRSEWAKRSRWTGFFERQKENVKQEDSQG